MTLHIMKVNRVRALMMYGFAVFHNIVVYQIFYTVVAKNLVKKIILIIIAKLFSNVGGQRAGPVRGPRRARIL